LAYSFSSRIGYSDVLFSLVRVGPAAPVLRHPLFTRGHARRSPNSGPASQRERPGRRGLPRRAGDPFFLRFGKKLAASRHVVTLGFRESPLRMFPVSSDHNPNGQRNEIIIDFADPGAMTAAFLAEEPGAQMRLGTAEMTFRYSDSVCAAHSLEGYELLDAMLGTLRSNDCGKSPPRR
jgi:glucose-6-phosphate 1-dehydrogenase